MNINLIVFVEDVAVRISKKGTEYGKITISDYSGRAEVFAWSNVWKDYGSMIRAGEVCALIIKKSTKEGDNMLVLEKVCNIIELPRKRHHTLNVELKEELMSNETYLSNLRDCFASNGGDFSVVLHFNNGEKDCRILVGGDYMVSDNIKTVEEIRECKIVKGTWWT